MQKGATINIEEGQASTEALAETFARLNASQEEPEHTVPAEAVITHLFKIKASTVLDPVLEKSMSPKAFLVDRLQFFDQKQPLKVSESVCPKQVTLHNLLDGYEQKEPGYFETSIKALLALSNLNLDFLLSFNTFDKLHSALTSHLDKNSQKVSRSNNFGLIPNVTTDQKGLTTLIETICKQGSRDVHYWLDVNFLDKRFYLLGKQIQTCEVRSGQVNGIRNTSFKNAVRDIVEPFMNGKCTIKLNLLKPEGLRIQTATDIISNLKLSILNIKNHSTISELEKTDALIKAIGGAMCALSQEHIYQDGNARATFIYSNFLFKALNIDPFYPQNQSFSDCKSQEGFLRDVKEGQEVFKSEFGTFQDLLDAFKQVISLDKKSSFAILK